MEKRFWLEDTDISFKIMRKIALAYNSEAFQQEPEILKSYYSNGNVGPGNC